MLKVITNQEAMKALVYILQTTLNGNPADLESPAVGEHVIKFLEAGTDIIRANTPISNRCTPIIDPDEKLLPTTMYGICTLNDMKPFGAFLSGDNETVKEFKTRIAAAFYRKPDEFVVYAND